MEVNLSPAVKHPVVSQLFTSDESWFTLSEKYECEWCCWWWRWRWLEYPSHLTLIQSGTVRTHGLSIPKVLECEMSRKYVSIITWTVLEPSPAVLGVSLSDRMIITQQWLGVSRSGQVRTVGVSLGASHTFRNPTGRTSEWIGWSHTHRVPGGSDGNESACNAGDLGSISGSGRFSGEGNGYPCQSSCLENSMDRESWWATVHGVAKSQTQLSD